MKFKDYTDEKYIPISELSSMGDAFVEQTKEYRQTFMEMVPVSDFEFANIVETPKLVKRRYEKNVELKGILDIKAENHDYILALALMIVKGEEIPGISRSMCESINKKYKENMGDLTIITNWLVDNVENITRKESGDIAHIIPELNVKDMNFIEKYNRPNEHYSIKEYLDLNGSSYETGRRALDKMANLKLYIKTKLGKKFVYKPTQKLANLVKGGEYGN